MSRIGAAVLLMLLAASCIGQGTITVAVMDSLSNQRVLVYDLYDNDEQLILSSDCLLYTSPSPRDGLLSRMPSSA